MPRNLFQVKIPPKWGKSTDCKWNIICFVSGQNTSACQTICHSSHEFFRKFSKTTNVTCFTKSKCRKMGTINRLVPIFNQYRHAKFQTIPPIRSLENAQKPQICMLVTAQNHWDCLYEIVWITTERHHLSCKEVTTNVWFIFDIMHWIWNSFYACFYIHEFQ